AVVSIQNVIDQGHPQLRAEKCALVPEEMVAVVESSLDISFGKAADGIGVIAQVDDAKVVFSPTRGVFQEAPGTPYLPLGVPIIFERVVISGQVYAKLIDRVNPSMLTPHRRQLLDRLAYNRRPVGDSVTAGLFTGFGFSPEMLVQVNPYNASAIPML